MLNLLKIVGFIILLSSCQKQMENPLMNFQLGESEEIWKQKIESNVRNGKLTDQYEGNTIYRYYFKKGNEKIYSDVHLNSDGYEYGNLRIIRFDLKGDTIYWGNNKKYNRSSGSRNKAVVDTLLSWFIDLYGSPDNVKPNNNSDSISNLDDYIKKRFYDKDLFKDRIRTPEEIYSEIFETLPRKGSFIWDLGNFTIEFYKETSLNYIPLSDSLSSALSDLLAKSNTKIEDESIEVTEERYEDPFVVFRIKDYEKYLKTITEPIRDTLKPKDIVAVKVRNPRWKNLYPKNYWDYDYRLTIDIYQISRIGREEPRDVNDVKFDIVICDVFDQELCRISDIEISLDKPIQLSNTFWTPLYNYSYYLNYISSSSKTKDFEIARIKNEESKLKCYAVVKAVVFEDGKVLK